MTTLRTFYFLLFITLLCCSTVGYSQRVTVNPEVLDSIKKKEVAGWNMRKPEQAIGDYNPTISDSIMEKEIKRSYPYWIVYIFLFQLALIVYVRVQYTKEFSEIFYVLRSNIITQQLYREAPTTGVRFAYFLLNVNFILSIATWVLILIKKHNFFTDYDDGFILFSLSGFILIAMIIRYIFLAFTSWMITRGKEINYFNYNELQIFRCAGLVLFPITVLIYFSPPPISKLFLIISFVITGTLFLYRYFRGFEIGKDYFYLNIFHFLVYICALEIAPVLIGIRLVTNILHQ